MSAKQCVFGLAGKIYLGHPMVGVTAFCSQAIILLLFV